MPRTRGTLLALLTVATLTVSGCGLFQSSAGHEDSSDHVSAVPVAAEPDVTTVIVVSVDALNPAAIRQLGTERAPTLNRLIDEGAATLNARTEHEQTNTLPNHTGMVTSRRINATYGGHGVVWNDDRLRPPTVQAAAGHPVSSVFSVLHSAGDKTAVFASKTKFSLFERSWPDGVDKYVERDDNGVLVRKLRKDISGHTRAFRFVHLSAPDVAGHAYGFMGPEYLDAVAATDKRLGRVVDTIQADPDLADHTVLVVTADHGGNGVNHRDEKKLANYRIPFIVWGAGVAPGTDLYDLNPEYADPGKARTTYADPEQPVRNGDVANLVTDLLGRSQVKGSELDAEQHLDVS